MRRLFVSFVMLMLFASGAQNTLAADAPAKLSTDTRVQLQSALRMAIDKTVVAGNYPHLDFKTGKVKMLHPASSHPMILRMGEFYIMCVDFRDEAGSSVNVDFYLAKKDKGFSVFQVEFANRAPLDALVKAGSAVMLE